MSERELATIRTIAEVQPIPGADKICAYRVDGWWVVDQVGKYEVGSLVTYLEVDSWVPHSIAPFLTKPDRDPMVYQEIQGQRLRTIKLKGQLSQGLLLPTQEYDGDTAVIRADGALRYVKDGDDMTDFLGILKWEKPMNAQLAGLAKGNFPSFIRKTDQPRIQNMTRQFQAWQEHGDEWFVSEKMDGSSMTVYFSHGEVEEMDLHGVCSRNLDLKQTEGNSFWIAAIELDLHNKIMKDGRSLAIQGEWCGPGIQGNQYGFDKLRFFCYDIFDIDRQEYLLQPEVIQFCAEHNIPMVPLLPNMKLSDSDTIASILKFAEGKSTYGNKPREGLVFKHAVMHDVSWKAISDSWLLKNE